MAGPETKQIQVDRETGPSPPTPRSLAGLPLVGLALAVIALISLPSLNGQPEMGPVDTTPPAPTPPRTEATPPTTDIAPSAAELTARPRDTPTSLGTFTWREVANATQTPPLGEIHADPVAGGYVIFSARQIWRSADGLEWFLDQEPWPFGDLPWVWIQDGFASASGPDHATVIYEARDAGWQLVSLPETPQPGAEGMVWQVWPGIPLASGDATIVPASVAGRIPWENHYGSVVVECELPEGCEAQPWAEWNRFSKQVLIRDPIDGVIVARLDTTRDGRRIIFADSDTGETVHELLFGLEAEAVSYLEKAHEDLWSYERGAFVRQADGEFEYRVAPFDGWVQIHPVPGGFVAYENIDRPPEEGYEPAVWTSADGATWQNRGEVAFLPDEYVFAHVDRLGEDLLAQVMLSYEAKPGSVEEWISDDGLEWSTRTRPFPGGDPIRQTNFGFVSTDWESGRFWVSGDSVTWEEVASPVRSGTWVASLGAVGDLLYLQTEIPAGQRTLWIATIDQPFS